MALSNPTLPRRQTPPSEDTRGRLQTLWQRNLPVLGSRLDLLAAAAAAAQEGTLSEPFQAEAISIAHKLAGSLGMFGYPGGTELALRLEIAFASERLDPVLLMQLAEELRASLHLALG